MRRDKILLVDDEENILYSLSNHFENEGYLVEIASSGKKALEKLLNGNFDLVITDLVMPEVDGIKVLEETRKVHPEAGTIILTGYGDMNSAIEALRLGADDYLLKPCDPEELLLRAERCLEKHKAYRKVKLYEKILPICVYCKSIRDDTGTEPGQGKWMPLEEYIFIKAGTEISHGCCPKCIDKWMSDD